METASAAGSLTKREQDVLELLSVGMTNREIAAQLGVAVRTVENHVERTLGKLGVSSRTRAVIEARRLGLLDAAIAAGVDSSVAAPPHNLPVPLTRLLGRAQELADVGSLLDAHRLVMLSGSGGVGKTRLALRVGADLLDRYPQGIWFCDFSAGSDPQFVDRAVAKVLGVQERPEHPLSEAIVRALKRKHALLVLSNCEHVVGAVAELADEILHNCQNIRILATSREPLVIIGEIVYRVRSLAFPDGASGLTANAAMRYEAIDLFVDRRGSSKFFHALQMTTQVSSVIYATPKTGIPSRLNRRRADDRAFKLNHWPSNSQTFPYPQPWRQEYTTPSPGRCAALIDWSSIICRKLSKLFFASSPISPVGSTSKLRRRLCPAENSLRRGQGLRSARIAYQQVDLSNPRFENATRYRLLESTTRICACEAFDEAANMMPWPMRRCSWQCWRVSPWARCDVGVYPRCNLVRAGTTRNSTIGGGARVDIALAGRSARWAAYCLRA